MTKEPKKIATLGSPDLALWRQIRDQWENNLAKAKQDIKFIDAVAKLAREKCEELKNEEVVITDKNLKK